MSNQKAVNLSGHVFSLAPGRALVPNWPKLGLRFNKTFPDPVRLSEVTGQASVLRMLVASMAYCSLPVDSLKRGNVAP